MTWKKLIIMSVPILVISTVLISGIAIASTGAQTWYLDSQSHSPVSSVPAMEREGTGSQSSSVNINNGGSKTWLSNESAASDVTFPPGTLGNTWVVYLKTSNWTSTCETTVGWGNASSPFNAFPGQAVIQRGYSGQGIVEILLTMGSQTVPAGGYLALQITNNSGSTETIYTDGTSWIQSPETDPGYPLPELVTGVLLSAGLVGLVVYVGIRRKAVINKTT